MALKSTPSGTTGVQGGSMALRTRSVAASARDMMRARATSDSTLRTRPWLRMRTTSAAVQGSGWVFMAANSGGSLAGSATVCAIQALMPATKASVMVCASWVP